jgi:hypothetical protein
MSQKWYSARKKAIKRQYQAIALPLNQFVMWYKTALATNNNQCQWCGETWPVLDLVVDHDHKTGLPRALVCNACNLAEGLGLRRLEIVAKVIRGWEQLI